MPEKAVCLEFRVWGYFPLIAFHLWIVIISSHIHVPISVYCIQWRWHMGKNFGVWPKCKRFSHLISTKFNFSLRRSKKRTLPSGASAVNSWYLSYLKEMLHIYALLILIVPLTHNKISFLTCIVYVLSIIIGVRKYSLSDNRELKQQWRKRFFQIFLNI